MIGNKRYLLNCLLSTLLVLTFVGAQVSCFAKFTALNANTYLSVVEEQKLTDRVMNSLNRYFTEKLPATSIPAEVYMNEITHEQVDAAIRGTITNAFAFLHGNAENVKVSMDFSALEESITSFFSEYAASIGYEKDAVYDQKVAATISVAEREILAQVDVFKFASLENAGLLSRAKTALPYLNYAVVGSLIACFVLAVLLVVINRKLTVTVLYWCGCALTISAGLLFILPTYVKATNYFAAFVIKSDRIYAAVTGSLNRLTDMFFWQQLVLVILGVLCIVGYAVCAALRCKKPPEQTVAPENPAEP